MVETFVVNELIKQAGWAKSSIEEADFRGLRLLRDRLGSTFVGGVLLDLGQQSFRHDDRLFVMPADRLWTPLPTSW
ncbi:hypothetical protein [Nonomuraea sp. NPDC003709]|uniref:hypothetical protein n=1 Tax=Nonomuraea sp. NPDC003709 TaxID=3154450 RepID=UPI0033B9977A